ncbi:hypothetical protein L9F63_018247, partial [Diploptera punctata]
LLHNDYYASTKYLKICFIKKLCTSCERSLNYATKMARMLQSSTSEGILKLVKDERQFYRIKV